MKPLYAKNNFGNYKKDLLPIDEIVPASVYDDVPDVLNLLPDIQKGSLLYPLLCFKTDQNYWQKTHLRLYKSGSPTLPDIAPEIDKQVFVVWAGRQRYQLAKQLGYTHIDCIWNDNFDSMVRVAQQYKNL